MSDAGWWNQVIALIGFVAILSLIWALMGVNHQQTELLRQNATIDSAQQEMVVKLYRECGL